MIRRLLDRLGSKRTEAPEATDQGPAQRRAAIARTDDPEQLLACMDEPELAGPARKRLAQLFDAGLDPFTLIALSDALARRRQLLDAVTRSEHWQPLLESLSGDDLLADVACHHPLAPVRHAAAERLVAEAALRQVEKVCRDKDKAVARLMRDRLDVLRQTRQRSGEIDQRLTALAEDMRHLARVEDEPRLAERLRWLEEQQQALCRERDALAEPMARFGQTLPDAPEAVTSFAAMAQTLRDRLRTEQDRIEAAAAAERAQSEAAAEQATAVTALERLLAQICTQMETHPEPASERNQWRTALALEQGRWEDIGQTLEPPPELARRHAAAEAVLSRLLTALDRLHTVPPPPELPEEATAATVEQQLASCGDALAAIDWPEQCPAPAAVRALQEARDALAARLTERTRKQRNRAEQVRRNVARLERAIEQGRMRQARAMRGELEALLSELPAQANDRLRQRADGVLARLDDLADWQQFATAPKRRDLCAAMEALAADADLAPEPRAARVKQLRSQWNELGPARDEEGLALVERFNAAAEAAFAPARSFFEAQAERHRFNAENRRRICDELEAFLDGYDWVAPDWRAVERIYQQARKEWRQYADVDPRERGIGRRYHALTRKLRDRLEARWQANIETKEALIRDAEALAAAPDASSPAAARRLQAAWKRVDITPRSVDRKLWDAFRTACDTLFATLDEQANAANAAFESSFAEVAAVIAALEADCRERKQRPLRARDGIDAAALRDAGARLQGLDKEAPGNAGVAKRLDGLRRQLEGIRKDAAALAQDSARRQALLDAEQALATADPAPADVNVARAAVVDLELALGIDCPDEDAELRMERQVKRLESGLRGENAADPVAAALAGITAAAGDAALRERARKAISQALDAAS